ncbi:MAG: hypothetical protein MHM6MM_001768 [Cercozoa sp. M6MM]
MLVFLIEDTIHPVVVVGCALALELSPVTDAAGLVVLLRLWRIVRIGHGVWQQARAQDAAKIAKLQSEVASLRARLAVTGSVASPPGTRAEDTGPTDTKTPGT